MSRFNVGDVVQLKSGGPPMTVCMVEVAEDTINGVVVEVVTCRYFDQNLQAKKVDCDARELIKTE